MTLTSNGSFTLPDVISNIQFGICIENKALSSILRRGGKFTWGGPSPITLPRTPQQQEPQVANLHLGLGTLWVRPSLCALLSPNLLFSSEMRLATVSFYSLNLSTKALFHREGIKRLGGDQPGGIQVSQFLLKRAVEQSFSPTDKGGRNL